ncbi:MAG: DNA mismatch repair endonuclease MutL [Saprospiraceae bacterium]|nr:DNA mismatch repair endonuclease MutL [Saprospiraceae bacterium]
MTDVIHLLPDNVANQIAAGEVVQRPSSVVKELLENSVDAGAGELRLIVRDAGKTLIQVIDNGCGMSETDARMCFERHATSKIREAKDLFAIRTMGFRGEALASIAAVAQVELRTRRNVDELGVRVLVEDSVVKAHEPAPAAVGTSIAVKNLFYNVPARRNFLRTDSVEMRHIMDEFQRIALAHPDLFFSLHHNEQEILHLAPGSLRQRIVKIFGDVLNKKLVPVQQNTEILKITGFVGNPDYFRKARGEQLFFVNNRFIKSNYLHHAVVSAYEDLMPDDSYPFYVLFLEVDPARVDINVHPTKQEVKFDDEKLVYNFLKVTVRHALGSHNVTPTLDFDQEPAFQPRFSPPTGTDTRTVAGERRPGTPSDRLHTSNLREWQRLYEGMSAPNAAPGTAEDRQTPEEPMPWETGVVHQQASIMDDLEPAALPEKKEPYQIHRRYILSQIKSGFLLIDQQSASERILYERYLQALARQPISTQQLLFPKSITLTAADAELMTDLLPELHKLGFDIVPFGGTEFVVHGIPAELGESGQEETLLEQVLAQYRDNLELQLGVQENLARALSRNAAVKRGRGLSAREMEDLIDRLFACSVPYSSPAGKPCIQTFNLEDLQKHFAA